MAQKAAVVRVIAETRQYDRSIDNAAKKLRDFGKDGVGSLAGLAGSWTKLVPAIGAAVGAHQLFDRAMQNSQALQEAFERTQLQLKTAVDNFFAAITSGDFSAFDAGISGIIAKAGDAANALDQLGNSMMSLGVVNAKEGLEYQKAMTRLRGAKKGTEEYQKALEDAAEAVGRMDAATGVVQSDQWDAIRKQVASWTNLGAQEIKFNWVLNAQTLDSQENRDELKEQAAANVKTYHDEVAKLNKEFFETVAGDWTTPGDVYQRVKAGKSVDDYDAAIKRLNETYGESIVANTLLNRKNDETLDGLDQLTIAYYGNARAIEGYRTQIARLQKGEDGGGGGVTAPKETAMGLKEIEAEIDRIQGKGGAVQPEVSVDRLQKLVKDAQKAASSAVGTSAQVEAEKVVQDLQRMLQDRVLTVQFRMQSVGGELTRLGNTGYSTEGLKAEGYTAMGGNSGPEQLQKAAESLDGSSLKGYTEMMERLTKRQNEANDAVAEWKALQDTAMTTGVDALTNAFGRLGDAIGGTTGSVIGMVAALAQEVVSGVAAISSLKAQEIAHKDKMNAALGDAAAETIAAHSFIPFVGVAMGLGMVASIVSALQGLPKFAEGGVATQATVGIFGEKGPEAIIPLDRLERMMDNRRRDGDASAGGKVEFVIRDRELYGVLKNYENRRARL